VTTRAHDEATRERRKQEREERLRRELPFLSELPILTMPRVCLLAGCSRSTVNRSPLVPVGKRGRTKIYRTADVLAWLQSGLTSASAAALSQPAARTKIAAAPSSPAIADRLAAAARGDVR
jgi:hypothetical protein